MRNKAIIACLAMVAIQSGAMADFENNADVSPSSKETPKASDKPNPQSGIAKPLNQPATSSGSSSSSSAISKPLPLRTASNEAVVLKNSDSLKGSLKEGKVTLLGNVDVQQGDTNMKSDACEIYSKPGTTIAEKALARGRVVLRKAGSADSPEIRAVADTIEYYFTTRKVTLKGKPKVWKGKELLQGQQIDIDLDTEEIQVKGASAILDPKSDSNPKSEKRVKGAK